jgi:hypothetical protein
MLSLRMSLVCIALVTLSCGTDAGVHASLASDLLDAENFLVELNSAQNVLLDLDAIIAQGPDTSKIPVRSKPVAFNDIVFESEEVKKLAAEIWRDSEEIAESKKSHALHLLYLARKAEHRKGILQFDINAEDDAHAVKYMGTVFTGRERAAEEESTMSAPMLSTDEQTEVENNALGVFGLVAALQRAIREGDDTTPQSEWTVLENEAAKEAFVRWLAARNEKACDILRTLSISIVHPFPMFDFDAEALGSIGERMGVNVVAMDVAAQVARACGVEVTLVRCQFANEAGPLPEGFVEAPRFMEESATTDWEALFTDPSSEHFMDPDATTSLRTAQAKKGKERVRDYYLRAYVDGQDAKHIQFPLVREVMRLGRTAAPDATHMVLSNGDVTPMPDMYLKIAAMMATGLDALQFTRVGIARELQGGWRAKTSLHRYFSAVATDSSFHSRHPGIDGFAFPAARIPCYLTEVGMTHWGCGQYGKSMWDVLGRMGTDNSKCLVKAVRAEACPFTFHMQHGGPSAGISTTRRRLSFGICNNHVQWSEYVKGLKSGAIPVAGCEASDINRQRALWAGTSESCPKQFSKIPEKQGKQQCRHLQAAMAAEFGPDMAELFAPHYVSSPFIEGLRVAEAAGGVGERVL